MKKLYLSLFLSLHFIGIFNLCLAQETSSHYTFTQKQRQEFIKNWGKEYGKELDTDLRSANWLETKVTPDLSMLFSLEKLVTLMEQNQDSTTLDIREKLSFAKDVYLKNNASAPLYRVLRKLVWVEESLKSDSLAQQYFDLLTDLENKHGYKAHTIVPKYTLDQQKAILDSVGVNYPQLAFGLKLLRSANVLIAKKGRLDPNYLLLNAEEALLLGAQEGFKGNYDNARKLVQISIENYELLGLSYSTWEKLYLRANIEKMSGQNEKAIKHFTYLIENLSEYEDLKFVSSTCYATMGEIYFLMGNFDQSFKSYEEAEKLINKENGLEREYYQKGMTKYLMGTSQMRLRNVKKALNYFEEAEQIMEEALNRSDIGPQAKLSIINNSIPIHSGFAQAYALTDNQEKALEYCIQVLEDRQQIDSLLDAYKRGSILTYLLDFSSYSRLIMANIYYTLGFSLSATRSFYLAEDYYNKALEKFSKSAMPDKEIIVLNSLTSIYLTLGIDIEKAHEYTKRAEELAKTNNLNYFLPGIYLDKSLYYRVKEDSKNQEKNLIIAKTIADTVENLYFKKKILVEYANLLTYEKRHDEALKLLDEAISISPKFVNDGIIEMESYMIKGFALNKAGRYKEAMEFFDKAIDFTNKPFERKQGELSQIISISKGVYAYHGAINTLLSQSRVEEAFLMWEKVKSKRFHQDFTTRKFLDQNVPDSLKSRADYFESSIQKNNLLLKDSDISDSQRSEIKDESILMLQSWQLNHEEVNSFKSDQFSSDDSFSLSQIQKVLDKDESLVEYIIGLDTTLAFVITNETIEVRKISTVKEIHDAFSEFSIQYLERAKDDPENKTNAAFLETASKLYQLLILPLKDTKGFNKSSLIIVPDGVLSSLPFELLISDTTKSDFWNYHYLLKDYKCIYSPSAKTLHYQRTHFTEKIAYSKDLLAIGDPIFDDNKSPIEVGKERLRISRRRSIGPEKPKRIPHSAKEIESISKHFDENRKDVWLREEAVEDSLASLNIQGRLSNYRIIHMATHGWIDLKVPAFSYLAFSSTGSSDYDGFLQLFEMTNLRMNPELVVLSACETGLGFIYSGEGRIGFLRNLMLSGTQNSLLSLWSVQDQSTAKLFDSFYKIMNESPEKSYYEAFREAQLKMIVEKRYANPYYWAPFVFTGFQN